VPALLVARVLARFSGTLLRERVALELRAALWPYDDGVKSAAAVPGDKRFVDIETRDAAASCGVTEAGEIWCWSYTSTSLYRVPLLAKAAVR
jgi:hypothetical protein